jgi:hypothetical protein
VNPVSFQTLTFEPFVLEALRKPLVNLGSGFETQVDIFKFGSGTVNSDLPIAVRDPLRFENDGSFSHAQPASLFARALSARFCLRSS